MFRNLTLALALVSASASACQLFAQTQEVSKAVSATPNVEMAAYARNYTSTTTQAHTASCPTCSPAFASGGGPSAMAFGQVWGGAQSMRDCARFYHYPYVYYPQNFMGDEYFRSSDSLYHRYPPEMQIPVYNRHWHNYYPMPRRYHWGHHFLLDVF